MSFRVIRDVRGDTSKINKTQQIPVGTPSTASVKGSIGFNPQNNSFYGVANRGRLPLSTGVISTVPVGVTPAGMAITLDGTRAYVANNNNYGITYEGDIPVICDSVSILDLTTPGYPVTGVVVDTSFNQPYTITIHPDGSKAYVTNSAGTTITIISMITNFVIGTIDGFDGPSGMVITPDGLTGYVINYGAIGGAGSGNGNTVNVVDLVNDVIVGSPITVARAPSGIVITSDGARVYTINYVTGATDGTMSVIDTSDNSSLFGIMDGLFGPFGIVLSPDDTKAYITNFGSNNFTPIGTVVAIVSLAEPTAPVVTVYVPTGIQPSGIAVDGNDRYLYVSNYNTLYADGENFTGLTAGEGTVSVIDLSFALPKVIDNIVVGTSPGCIIIHPDGDRALVSNFSSNTVSVIALM